jgi:HEAT repeat protein
MEQADSRLRGRGLSALQPTKNLINKLVSQLEGGGDWRARRTAAEFLGYFGIGRALEPLLKHIGEFEHWLVRVAAVEALGQIANQIDASGTQVLLETLNQDRSLNVRTATAECLGCIPDQIVDTEDALVRSLIYDEAWRVRRAAAEALALSESVGAVQEMAVALRDSHFRVRREAALALGQLLPKLRGLRSKQSGMNSLRETAEKDASEFVRRAAKDALIRAGG